MFTWVRISINVFFDWENRIGLPLEKFDMSKTTINNSMVYTVEHEASDEVMADRVGLLDKVSKVADACGSKYIRLLPNCLLKQENLINQTLDLAKLSQNLLKGEDLNKFINRSLNMIK